MNNENFKIYRKPSENEFIVAGVDTAWGGNDYCSAQFLSVTRRDVPIVYHSRELATEMTPRLFDMLTNIYNWTKVKPTISYERNNGGVAELERLSRMNKFEQFTIYQQKSNVGTIMGSQQSIKLGWDTTSSTRPIMLGDLKDAIDNFYLTIYDRSTLNELLSFVIVQGNTGSWKAQAEVGMHDDLIMALGIAWQLYQTERVRVNESGIITPKQPGTPKKSPYVDEEGNLVGVGMDKLLSNAVKDTLKPRGRDWRYPR